MPTAACLAPRLAIGNRYRDLQCCAEGGSAKTSMPAVLQTTPSVAASSGATPLLLRHFPADMRVAIEPGTLLPCNQPPSHLRNNGILLTQIDFFDPHRSRSCSPAADAPTLLGIARPPLNKSDQTSGDLMKTALLASTAMATGLALAAPANAAEFEVGIGGDFEMLIGFASSDVDNATVDVDGVDVKQEGGIEFRPSIELDNGIQIGASVTLESTTDEDTIDESYMFIESAFGQIELGSRVSAAYTMSLAAPDVTLLNANDGQTGDFVPFDGDVGGVAVGSDTGFGTLNSTFIENGLNEAAQRFIYFTPRLAGFQVGVSYARDPFEDDNSQVDFNADSFGNIFDVGANYVESFGGFDVGVSGRWGIATDDVPGDNPTIYAGGVNLGFAGVTVGGSFAEQNGTVLSDGQSFDLGISYETGPWGFSFTYVHGENLDDEAPVAGADEELDQYLVGASYSLADGVLLNAYGAYVVFEEDVGDAGGAGDDVDGFIIGTGILIEF
ncbi:MAG: porin [Pseudomonadota bacterium]